jgi:uncharacterized protein involved in exopolysaccharide biosynthesis
MGKKTIQSQQPSEELIDQSSVLWFILFLGRARRFVLVSSLVIAVSSAIVVFLLPVLYESTVTFVPPRESGVLSSLGSLSTALREFAPLRAIGGIGGAKGTSYNYLSILGSRYAKEAMVRKFDLMRVYNVSDSSMEKTMKELEDNYSVTIAEEGHISVTVQDTDPVRAAAMANEFIEILNRANTDLNLQSATKYREFVEGNVKEAKDSLRISEEAYKRFQKGSGGVAVPEDVQGGAKAVAELYSERAVRELEVQFLSKVMGSDNPELAKKKLELQILNQKVASIPDLGLEQLRLYRNLVIQSKILEVLIPLYEQARMEEKKDVPSVGVLDRAMPAEKKSKPKRMLIVLIATLSAAFLSLSIFAFRERLATFQSTSPEHYEIFRSLFRLRNRR